ncbi:MAG: hypothetical protein NUV46_00380 [Nanoarchaeota archaeon]|nr:hypothetical protein [Nanoarchaeota archaeon]
MAGRNWLVELREVILVFGILLIIISYFKDSFNFLGYYFIFGVMVILFAIVLYVMRFFERFE